MLKKIVIGTANFSKNYGITKNHIKNHDLKKIFIFCKKMGITFFDTAKLYGSSEKKIGIYKKNNLNIITKLPKIDKKNIDYFIKKNIEDTLFKVKEKKLYGVLLHNPQDLLSINGDQIYMKLLELKKKNIIKKIGISSYSTKEVDQIISKYNIDLLQIPFSIFDRRIIKNRWLRKIKSKKIEIHVRSIFLQGLLTQNPAKISKKFKKWSRHFLKWDSFCNDKKITKELGALKFVQMFKDINKIIIGIKGFKDLKNNIENYSIKKKINFPNNLSCYDKKLINPYNWNDL